MTGQTHGIEREIQPGSQVWEYTCKDGKWHGLFRWISGSKVEIYLHDDVSKIAKLSLNNECEEIYRGGNKA